MKKIKNILNRIGDFTKVKETFDTLYQVEVYSNRLKWLISLVKELKIDYFVDVYGDEKDEVVRNLCLKGKSDKMVIAHYDIANLDSDNANDNSASVLNAIALKVLNPEVNVVLADAEEVGCEGAKQLARNISRIDSPFKDIKWILNLELTGLGDKVMVSNYSNKELYKKITQNFDVTTNKIIGLNDSLYLNKKGIDSEIVSICPSVGGEIDYTHFENCHKLKDNIDTIKISDMERFVLNFLLPITLNN